MNGRNQHTWGPPFPASKWHLVDFQIIAHFQKQVLSELSWRWEARNLYLEDDRVLNDLQPLSAGVLNPDCPLWHTGEQSWCPGCTSGQCLEHLGMGPMKSHFKSSPGGSKKKLEGRPPNPRGSADTNFSIFFLNVWGLCIASEAQVLSVPSDSSWWGSEEHKGFQGANSGLSHAGQVPSPLYSLQPPSAFLLHTSV